MPSSTSPSTAARIRLADAAGSVVPGQTLTAVHKLDRIDVLGGAHVIFNDPSEITVENVDGISQLDRLPGLDPFPKGTVRCCD